MYCPPHLMWVSTLPWQKWIVKFPRVQQPVLILFSQNLLCSRSRHCTREWVHIEDNSSSSCLSCLVLLVFLTLFFFNFLNFMLTVWTTAFIGCVVWFCYNVEELRSRYDAKLQRVFLTLFSVVFLQKFQNWVWKRKKKFCGNKTSISCWTRENLTIHFHQGSVGTHIRHGGQYIPHIVYLLSCNCAKNYRNRLTFE